MKKTKQKIISIMLATILIFTFIPSVFVIAAANDFVIKDDVLVKYNGKGGAVIIPNGVTVIGNRAFLDCTSLTSITIPNSVTSIGIYAFKNCTNLTSITIPNTVIYIGGGLFNGCINLKSVILPNKVNYFEVYDAFANCTSLTSITLPIGVTSIDFYAFYNCTILTNITIPNSVTSIGQEAFANCTNLTSITIPNGVTSIGDYAFECCENLTSITLPNGIASIGDYAFYYCPSLTNITIPNSVTFIGDYAFANYAPYIVFFVEANSYAQKYAQKHHITYVLEKPDYSVLNNPNLKKVKIVKPIDIEFYLMRNYYCTVELLQTIVNADGSISVLDTENAIVYEYSENMEFIKTQTFKKELDMVGAFTKDADGNYYIFYAKEVKENSHTEKNMALIKYSQTGEKIKDFWLEAEADDSYYGVKIPFDFGTCRLEISGDMIAVYFARQMFKTDDGLNHQASYGFILNINTFERLTGSGRSKLRIPYVSHSFNQFILPVDDGFVFVDHGDGDPRRAFEFSKVINGSNNRYIESERFVGASGNNWTGAEMGGLAKTPNGYIFVAARGDNKIENDTDNNQNLYILTINKDLTEISKPIWITHYTDRLSHVVSPKIVQLNESRYLLLWEVRYLISSKTFMAIVDDEGKIITPAKEIIGTILNINDVLRYNPKTGLVHWATITGNGEINLYSLDVSKELHYAPPITTKIKAGDVVNTNLTVSINGNKIPANHIGGMAVSVEDLKNYGFNVEYKEISNSYHITGYDMNKKITPLSVTQNKASSGSKKGEYFYTDKTVYVNGKRVDCYEINNKVVILTNELEPFANLVWNGDKKEIVITTK